MILGILFIIGFILVLVPVAIMWATILREIVRDREWIFFFMYIGVAILLISSLLLGGVALLGWALL